MKLKSVLLIFCVLGILIFSGCDIKIEAGTPPTEEGSIGEGGKCLMPKDCKEGLHCFNKECISNDILDNFEECVNNACTKECTNCKKRVYNCMKSSEGFKDNKCVECFMNLQCKEGFICEEYKCVTK